MTNAKLSASQLAINYLFPKNGGLVYLASLGNDFPSRNICEKALRIIDNGGADTSDFKQWMREKFDAQPNRKTTRSSFLTKVERPDVFFFTRHTNSERIYQRARILNSDKDMQTRSWFFDKLQHLRHSHDFRLRLIKELSIKHEDNWQSVATPYDIVERMVELCDTEYYIVFFSAEFVEALRMREVPPENVVFVADNLMESKFVKNLYGVETIMFSETGSLNSTIHLIVSKAVESFNLAFKGDGMPSFEKVSVVMNPPYQQSDGGHGASAKPIYHRFIEAVIDNMEPQHLVSIHPSRYQAGGKGNGLEDFRRRIKNDRRVKQIIDFPQSKEVFCDNDIKGGVQILHWSVTYDGNCIYNGVETDLSEYEIIVNDNSSKPILDKVLKNHHKFFDGMVYGRNPFGICSHFDDFRTECHEGLVPCFTKNGKYNVLASAVNDKNNIMGLWKVCVGRASTGQNRDSNNKKQVIAKAFVLPPGTICTETYLVIAAFKDQNSAENCKSYAWSKFFRFMLGLRVNTQDVTSDKYKWVPDLSDYTKHHTDSQLYSLFGLSEEEAKYIEDTIKAFE